MANTFRSGQTVSMLEGVNVNEVADVLLDAYAIGLFRPALTRNVYS
ncbi:hypothetical protein [Pseudarthrobacter sp. AB1]|nr:hypothetical protein [Pseudarthrobacter sp. AB1]